MRNKFAAAFGLALTFAPGAAFAQNEQAPPPQEVDSFEENKFFDRTHFGIKLGLVFPSMSYSSDNLDVYSSSVYANGLFELFGEYEIIPSLSVRPGFKYITRGQHIDDYGIEYEFDAEYTEIVLPAVYTFQAIGNTNIYPYLLGGPVLGFAQRGEISYHDGNVGRYTEIDEGNLSSFSFGLHFGAGIKYPMSIKEFRIVPGFEAGYHLGLTDTYSDKEINGTANALNAPYYNIKGTRKHRGLEFGIAISVPMANFKKRKPPEPVPVFVPEPVPEPEPEKLCHTIDEIKDLIRLGQDIRGKKICAVRQVNFKTGSSELTTEDKVYLDEMVILMQTNELIKIRVNGHTDNVGGDEFNTNLSRDRAKSVHDYLKSKGIDSSRLSYTYFGSTRPIADNDTEEGKAINRRVEFEIINQ